MQFSIWERQKTITRQLFAWAGLSILIGGILNLDEDRFRKGVGVQFAGWGLINALIAIFGSRATARRKAQLLDPEGAEVTTVERQKLRRLLWLNTVLDVFYMLGGGWLARSKGRNDRYWRGQGLGIILQGAFLFFFDLLHALFLQERRG